MQNDESTIIKNLNTYEEQYINKINLPMIPVKFYHNACENKFKIINQFKNVSGIYLWFNKINKKKYIKNVCQHPIML